MTSWAENELFLHTSNRQSSNAGRQPVKCECVYFALLPLRHSACTVWVPTTKIWNSDIHNFFVFVFWPPVQLTTEKSSSSHCQWFWIHWTQDLHQHHTRVFTFATCWDFVCVWERWKGVLCLRQCVSGLGRLVRNNHILLKDALQKKKEKNHL